MFADFLSQQASESYPDMIPERIWSRIYDYVYAFYLIMLQLAYMS